MLSSLSTVARVELVNDVAPAVAVDVRDVLASEAVALDAVWLGLAPKAVWMSLSAEVSSFRPWLSPDKETAPLSPVEVDAESDD